MALARDPQVERVVCAPGNAGTPDRLPVDPSDAAAVVALAAGFDLVVVGPEGPLVAGVADAVRAAGVPCFGPSAAAAQLEGSKAFAKQVMAGAGVATAAAAVLTSADEAAAHLASAPRAVRRQGRRARRRQGRARRQRPRRRHRLRPRRARRARQRARRRGLPRRARGVAVRAVTDGTTVVPLLPAQDFKRVGDGDTGPNTGGMGAYAPLPWLPAATVAQVQREVLQPVVDEMARRGTPFAGLLYAGLAMTSPARRSSSSTAASATPRRRSSSPCSRRRSPGCCSPAPPAGSPRTRSCFGATARR